jgi:hypothetical protein
VVRPRPSDPRRIPAASDTRAMSTRTNPPFVGGNGSPAITPPSMNSSGATPNQPTTARTPSASASGADSKRRIVDTATPTSVETAAHDWPDFPRALSTRRNSSPRSNGSAATDLLTRTTLARSRPDAPTQEPARCKADCAAIVRRPSVCVPTSTSKGIRAWRSGCYRVASPSGDFRSSVAWLYARSRHRQRLGSPKRDTPEPRSRNLSVVQHGEGHCYVAVQRRTRCSLESHHRSQSNWRVFRRVRAGRVDYPVLGAGGRSEISGD